MRNQHLVCVLGAALEKALKQNVCICQGEEYTEWRVGDVGFAVGPHPELYPPKQLLTVLVEYFNKYLPKHKA